MKAAPTAFAPLQDSAFPPLASTAWRTTMCDAPADLADTPTRPTKLLPRQPWA